MVKTYILVIFLVIIIAVLVALHQTGLELLVLLHTIPSATKKNSILHRTIRFITMFQVILLGNDVGVEIVFFNLLSNLQIVKLVNSYCRIAYTSSISCLEKISLKTSR